MKAAFDLEDIREQAVDLFGKADDLEYYDGEDWRKLDDMHELHYSVQSQQQHRQPHRFPFACHRSLTRNMGTRMIL